MPFTPSYAIVYAIYRSSAIFFLNVMLQYITLTLVMLIRVMLCFLGKVEGISRGIAVSKYEPQN